MHIVSIQQVVKVYFKDCFKRIEVGNMYLVNYKSVLACDLIVFIVYDEIDRSFDMFLFTPKMPIIS